MQARLVCLLVLVGGCATEAFDDTTPLLAPLADPGSPEEVGIVAFLNHDSTTFELLDIDVPLDRRAARNLIDHRERQRFATVAEVDAVPYVGSVALQKILRWTLDNGWVSIASGDGRDEPTPACDTTTPLAGRGEPCLATASCADGLRCVGIPRDRSSSDGRCVVPTPILGEGARCDRFTPCDDELVCAGWTLWGEGNCVPTWMARRWTNEVGQPIHDSPSGGLSSGIVVEGLASVPVDIEVVVRLEHPRLTDLRVTLIDPNGDKAVLWDRTHDLETWSRSFVTTGISRDDEVNGRWSLHVEDMVAGHSGILHEWTLYLVSRWD